MRTFQRFPVQQPLEVYEDLLSFVALQTGIDANRLSDYASELDQYREVCAQLSEYSVQVATRVRLPIQTRRKPTTRSGQQPRFMRLEGPGIRNRARIGSSFNGAAIFRSRKAKNGDQIL